MKTIEELAGEVGFVFKGKYVLLDMESNVSATKKLEALCKAYMQDRLSKLEPVALMDSVGVCTITLHMVSKLEEGKVISRFPYELWPTKLYDISTLKDKP